jgi:hypothetical protein
LEIPSDLVKLETDWSFRIKIEKKKANNLVNSFLGESNSVPDSPGITQMTSGGSSDRSFEDE